MKFLQNFLTDLGNMLASMMKFGAECAVDAIADAGKNKSDVTNYGVSMKDDDPVGVFKNNVSPTGYSEYINGTMYDAKKP